MSWQSPKRRKVVRFICIPEQEQVRRENNSEMFWQCPKRRKVVICTPNPEQQQHDVLTRNFQRLNIQHSQEREAGHSTALWPVRPKEDVPAPSALLSPIGAKLMIFGEERERKRRPRLLVLFPLQPDGNMRSPTYNMHQNAPLDIEKIISLPDDDMTILTLSRSQDFAAFSSPLNPIGPAQLMISSDKREQKRWPPLLDLFPLQTDGNLRSPNFSMHQNFPLDIEKIVSLPDDNEMTTLIL